MGWRKGLVMGVVLTLSCTSPSTSKTKFHGFDDNASIFEVQKSYLSRSLLDNLERTLPSPKRFRDLFKKHAYESSSFSELKFKFARANTAYYNFVRRNYDLLYTLCMCSNLFRSLRPPYIPSEIYGQAISKGIDGYYYDLCHYLPDLNRLPHRVHPITSSRCLSEDYTPLHLLAKYGQRVESLEKSLATQEVYSYSPQKWLSFLRTQSFWQTFEELSDMLRGSHSELLEDMNNSLMRGSILRFRGDLYLLKKELEKEN